MGELTDALSAEELALFARVVDHGGFSAAARATGITQVKLSRRVAALERKLGGQLLQRSTRRIALTPLGRVVHNHAKQINEELAAARAVVAAFRGEPSGELFVTAPIILGQALFPTLLSRYVELHPKVRVTVDLSGQRADLIDEQFDVAVRVGPLPSSGLVAKKLGLGSAGLYGAPSYFDLRDEPKRLDDLREHRLLHNRAISRTSATPEWQARDKNGDTTSIAIAPFLVSNDSVLLTTLACAGWGIARLPTFAVGTELDEGRLRRVLPDYTFEHVDVHAVFPSQRGVTPAARALLDLLGSELPPLLAQA